METKGSVKGILKDKHGMPVADAAVMITGGTHEFTDIASISNGQGEFFVSVGRIKSDPWPTFCEHNQETVSRSMIDSVTYERLDLEPREVHGQRDHNRSAWHSRYQS